MDKFSPMWLPKQNLNKNNTDRHANIEELNVLRPQLQTENYTTENQGMMRFGEIVLQSDETPNWFALPYPLQ